MTRDVKLLLHDIIRVLSEIEMAIAGVTRETYSSTFNLPESVNYRLIVAGEAANQLLKAHPDLEAQFPELERLIAVRHRIVHGYFSVSDTQVWAIVTEHTPGLSARLQSFADELP
jgi:uncharacterized protein with HEPN domain